MNKNVYFEFSSGLLMSVSVYFVVVVLRTGPSVETFSNYDFEVSKKQLLVPTKCVNTCKVVDAVFQNTNYHLTPLQIKSYVTHYESSRTTHKILKNKFRKSCFST